MENKITLPELKNKYSKLRLLHASTVRAVQRFEVENKLLRKSYEFYKEQLFNADKNVNIQKKIVIDNLMQSQVTQDNLVKEVKQLRKVLKQRS